MTREILAALLSTPLAALGCAGSETAPAGAGTTGSGGSPAQHAVPPPPGPAGAPNGMGTATFALRRLYLGETRRDGTPDPKNAWKLYGYDIDGLITPGHTKDTCRPVDATP